MHIAVLFLLLFWVDIYNLAKVYKCQYFLKVVFHVIIIVQRGTE